MVAVQLQLERLARADGPAHVSEFDSATMRQRAWNWDRVEKTCHVDGGHCWLSYWCLMNLYVKDGVVLREEQAPGYPLPKDERVPDCYPKGCQKGLSVAHRMYDPSRVKYPLKRVGQRGEGKWQRLSWDQALTEVSDVLIDTLLAEGPQTIIDPGAGMMLQGSQSYAFNFLYQAIGMAQGSDTANEGDNAQGAHVTFGKSSGIGDSNEAYLYSDLILMWSGNPVYTFNAVYHYLPEARYNGAKVICIAPDYNPSATHADVWVPIKIGTDAALALAIAQVMLAEGKINEPFIKEQTDLPFLVKESDGKFLREKDLKKGGRDDVFYIYDQKSRKVVEAPRATLKLGNLDPALRGEFEVKTVEGKAKVRPVLERLRRKLDAHYTPEQVSPICGIPVQTIRMLAQEVGKAKALSNTQSTSLYKAYHGSLMERSIILLFVLGGHLGRLGANYRVYAAVLMDTKVGGGRKLDEMMQAVAAGDPRYAKWVQDGWTQEMIVHEMQRGIMQAKRVNSGALFHNFHAGLLELGQRTRDKDPHLKRPVEDYIKEAMDKKWQVVTPEPGTDPKVLIAVGGSFIRKVRGTEAIIKTLLPKLRAIIAFDTRLGSSAMYADYVLPCAYWYEKWSTSHANMPTNPACFLQKRVVDPLYESKSEWTIAVLLTKRIAQRAKERGLEGRTYKGVDGVERKLTDLADVVTVRGLYDENAEEDVARDAFTNASNLPHDAEWEDFKETPIVPFKNVSLNFRAIGGATDLKPGEPVVCFTWHTEKKEPWPTLTRRVQLYIDHDWYLELGEELPTHKDQPKHGGNHPFQLTGGHTRWSIHSCQSDDTVMLQLQRGSPALFLSVRDAKAKGIAEGDWVEVSNSAGSFQAVAAVSPNVRPGQLVIYHGWENFQFPGWKHFKSVMSTPTNPIYWAGGYGHVNMAITACQPGHWDRGMRVDVRKAAPNER